MFSLKASAKIDGRRKRPFFLRQEPGGRSSPDQVGGQWWVQRREAGSSASTVLRMLTVRLAASCQAVACAALLQRGPCLARGRFGSGVLKCDRWRRAPLAATAALASAASISAHALWPWVGGTAGPLLLAHARPRDAWARAPLGLAPIVALPSRSARRTLIRIGDRQARCRRATHRDFVLCGTISRATKLSSTRWAIFYNCIGMAVRHMVHGEC